MSYDPFHDSVDSVWGAARSPFAVAPNDGVALPTVPKALYIGTGGTVTLRGVDAIADVVFRNVANGQVLDIRAQFVRATGTSATDIVALV